MFKLNPDGSGRVLLKWESALFAPPEHTGMFHFIFWIYKKGDWGKHHNHPVNIAIAFQGDIVICDPGSCGWMPTSCIE